MPAFSLYDLVGVDSHLQRSQYRGRYPQMNALLSNLGAAHIRDSIVSPMSTTYTSELSTLHQQYGIDFTMTTSIGQSSGLWAQYAGAMGGALVALEGVNEPNNNVPNWNPAPTRQLQRDIWTATHGGQSSLTGVKSVNASVLNCDGNAAYGDQSSTTDFATMHKYWPGFNPNTTGYGSSRCAGSSGQYGSLDYNVHSVQQAAHHPIYVTESGYCTANVHGCVPEAVAAAYEPEIALTMSQYGGGGVFARQFIYEISSEDTSTKDGTLGLTDPSLTPKPMYYAVAGMLKRLKDNPGAGRVPISYAIAGNTTNLKSIALSYSDGSYGMVLFQDVQIWDPNGGATPQGSPINVATDKITLTVNGQTLANVTASTYGASGQWTDTSLPASQPVALAIGTYMTILHWKNGGGGPPPTPSATPTVSATPTPSISPSPTPTASSSPLPSPSVGPTASSTPSMTPTPTISPTPPASPAPTPTPTPTPTSSASPGGNGIAIDAGGHASGNWLEDQDYSGGAQASYFRGPVDTSGVASAAPQAVYQSGRYGSAFSYQAPGLTPGAAYTVRLHFCENYWTTAGRRVFNASLTGTTQTLANFDIIAQSGAPHKAIAVDFPGVVADALGTITVSFTAGVDTALVNGIEVH